MYLLYLGKEKATLIKSRVTQTDSKTNASEYKCSNSRTIKFKVEFHSDIRKKLDDMALVSGKSLCRYDKWKPSNNLIPSSGQSNTNPIRQLVLITYYNSIYLKLNIFLFSTDWKFASI